MNPAFDNAVYRVRRLTQTGSEDGTPITTTAVVEVEGWFDEPFAAGRAIRTNRQGQAVPTIQRIALFAFELEEALFHRDEGEILMAGISQGWWSVERIDTVPIPGGISHYEAQLQKMEEGR